jgi:hypothetical protein
MQLVDSARSTFTTQELERLAAYRAAVVAGFYTDWDGSAESTDTQVLAWLAGGDGATYPFTAEEREHLERCRTAFACGAYSDDLPPPPVDSGATSREQTR